MSQTAVSRKSKPTSPWKPAKKLNNPNAVQSLNGRWGYLFTAPFFVMFLIFGLAPILYSVYIAFFNWDALGTQEFIGLANFDELFIDTRFWNALINTLDIWLLSTIPMLMFSLISRPGGDNYGMALAIAFILTVVTTVIVFAVGLESKSELRRKRRMKQSVPSLPL